MSDRGGDSGSIFTWKKHPHLARYFFIKNLVLQPQQNMTRISQNENIDGNRPVKNNIIDRLYDATLFLISKYLKIR